MEFKKLSVIALAGLLALSSAGGAVASGSDEDMRGWVNKEDQSIIVLTSVDVDDASTAKMMVNMFADTLIADVMTRPVEDMKHGVPECRFFTGKTDEGEKATAGMCHDGTSVIILLSNTPVKSLSPIVDNYFETGEWEMPSGYVEQDMED